MNEPAIPESGTGLSSKLRIALLDFIASITEFIAIKFRHRIGRSGVYKNNSLGRKGQKGLFEKPLARG